MKGLFQRILRSRQGGSLLLALLYLALCTVMRAGLLVASHDKVGWGWATAGAFLTGFAFRTLQSVFSSR